MQKVKKMKELLVETKDKPGMLAEVTSKIADSGVNIQTLCAYALEDKAYFMMITSDIEKAKGALSDYSVREKEVVVVNLKNEIGSASNMARILKAADINLEYIYGTTCDCNLPDCECRIVFSSNDNDKAVEVLSK